MRSVTTMLEQSWRLPQGHCYKTAEEAVECELWCALRGSVFLCTGVCAFCVCVRLPTMWFHFLTEQKGCVSFIICPLRVVSLSPFFAASYATLLLFHLFCPFLKSHLGRGAEKKWRQREREQLQSRRNCPY